MKLLTRIPAFATPGPLPGMQTTYAGEAAPVRSAPGSLCAAPAGSGLGFALALTLGALFTFTERLEIGLANAY